MATVPEKLKAINKLTCYATRNIFVDANTCILTAHALQFILRTALGYRSRLVRVTATVFPPHHGLCARTLGGEPNGNPRQECRKCGWAGHLAVLVDERWILDPTFDQLTLGVIRMPPIAFELASLSPQERTYFKVKGHEVRYNLFAYQNGFAHKPDSRKSHWMLVVEEVMQSKGFLAL